MDRKLKLVKLILVESESLKDSENTQAAAELAQQLIRDAVELANLIETEAA